MSHYFISHSSEDDDFVRELHEALQLHGQDGWIDSCYAHHFSQGK